jgi:hypothetical protein
MHAQAASDLSRKRRFSSEGPLPVRVRLMGGFSVWVGSRAVGEGAWHLRKKCVYTATIGRSADGLSPPGEITVAPRVNVPNGVVVSTHNSAGAPESRGFHLALNCPA